jgi:hypothetical protein
MEMEMEMRGRGESAADARGLHVDVFSSSSLHISKWQSFFSPFLSFLSPPSIPPSLLHPPSSVLLLLPLAVAAPVSLFLLLRLLLLLVWCHPLPSPSHFPRGPLLSSLSLLSNVHPSVKALAMALAPQQLVYFVWLSISTLKKAEVKICANAYFLFLAFLLRLRVSFLIPPLDFNIQYFSNRKKVNGNPSNMYC